MQGNFGILLIGMKILSQCLASAPPPLPVPRESEWHRMLVAKRKFVRCAHFDSDSFDGIWYCGICARAHPEWASKSQRVYTQRTRPCVHVAGRCHYVCVRVCVRVGVCVCLCVYMDTQSSCCFSSFSFFSRYSPFPAIFFSLSLLFASKIIWHNHRKKAVRSRLYLSAYTIEMQNKRRNTHKKSVNEPTKFRK